MAVDIDKDIKKSLARHPNIRWRKLSFPVRKRAREFLRLRSGSELTKLSSNSMRGLKSFHFEEDDVVTFRDQGWLFIEEFLSVDSHRKLASNWPRTRWFQPLKSSKSKTYDSAFQLYVRQTPDALVHKALQDVYRFFSSTEFESQVSKLSVDDAIMQCYWTTTIQSYYGSGLAPHRDTPEIDSSGRDRRINLIYFVDSNGQGWEAGGTAILKSNKFSDPVFIPGILKNSLLIYETGAPFFHGFPPIKFGKFRRVLTAHYEAFD